MSFLLLFLVLPSSKGVTGIVGRIGFVAAIVRLLGFAERRDGTLQFSHLGFDILQLGAHF